jgi:hypothetical protein
LAKPIGPEMKALFIMSIVVPVGLLASLRLTGMLREPVKVVIADPIHWRIERPSLGAGQSFSINQTVQNTYVDDHISVDINILIFHYFEDFLEIPYGDNDGVDFRVNSSISTMQGHVESVLVRCEILDSNAGVWVSTVEHLKVQNMNVTTTKYFGVDTAYVEAQILEPSSSLQTQVDWVFADEHTQDHRLKVTSEVSYSTDEEGRKVVVPVFLEVVLST